MNQFGYGWEKLFKAVHSLAGAEDQKQRLVNAVAGSLIFITPDRDLPPELRPAFVQFMQDITTADTEGDEGAIQATIDNLDEWSVHRAIEKIIGFYDTVRKL